MKRTLPFLTLLTLALLLVGCPKQMPQSYTEAILSQDQAALNEELLKRTQSNQGQLQKLEAEVDTLDGILKDLYGKVLELEQQVEDCGCSEQPVEPADNDGSSDATTYVRMRRDM